MPAAAGKRSTIIVRTPGNRIVWDQCADDPPVIVNGVHENLNPSALGETSLGLGRGELGGVTSVRRALAQSNAQANPYRVAVNHSNHYSACVH